MFAHADAQVDDDQISLRANLLVDGEVVDGSLPIDWRQDTSMGFSRAYGLWASDEAVIELPLLDGVRAGVRLGYETSFSGEIGLSASFRQVAARLVASTKVSGSLRWYAHVDEQCALGIFCSDPIDYGGEPAGFSFLDATLAGQAKAWREQRPDGQVICAEASGALDLRKLLEGGLPGILDIGPLFAKLDRNSFTTPRICTPPVLF